MAKSGQKSVARGSASRNVSLPAKLPVRVARSPNQRRQRKTIHPWVISEGGFRRFLPGQHRSPRTRPLLDDIKVLTGHPAGGNDGLGTPRKKSPHWQCSTIKKGQVVSVHQVERRVVHQKRHGAMYVYCMDGRLPVAAKGVVYS